MALSSSGSVVQSPFLPNVSVPMRSVHLILTPGTRERNMNFSLACLTCLQKINLNQITGESSFCFHHNSFSLCSLCPPSTPTTLSAFLEPLPLASLPSLPLQPVLGPTG